MPMIRREMNDPEDNEFGIDHCSAHGALARWHEWHDFRGQLPGDLELPRV